MALDGEHVRSVNLEWPKRTWTEFKKKKACRGLIVQVLTANQHEVQQNRNSQQAGWLNGLEGTRAQICGLTPDVHPNLPLCTVYMPCHLYVPVQRTLHSAHTTVAAPLCAHLVSSSGVILFELKQFICCQEINLQLCGQ